MRDTFLLDVSSVKFDDTLRQRKELEGVEELAESIKRLGLLAPIIVDEDDQLIAGRRRLEAHFLLKLDQIPARRFNSLSPIERRVIELDENIRRVDLSWQDRAQAIYEIHQLRGGGKGEGQIEALAEFLGLSASNIAKTIRVAEALHSGDERVKAAAHLNQASELLSRRKKLEIQTVLSQIGEPSDGNELHPTDMERCEDLLLSLPPIPDGEGRTSAGGVRALAPVHPSESRGTDAVRSSTPASLHRILQADFLQFAASYSGPRFNFIHCDFPYGINLDKSDAAGTEAHDTSYADSEEVFWQLTSCLMKHKNQLFLDSAHMLFWYSMKYHDELIDLLTTEGFFVHDFPLIWHKSCGSGIASDYRRRPKHIYETALWCSLGDRPLVQLKNDLFSAPIARHKEDHVSAKPVEMLKYFLSMGVNDLTRFFDPTCGSGTSIRAAKALGAESALGLELNPETAAAAQVKLSLEL